MSGRRTPYSPAELGGLPGFAVSAAHPLGSDLARFLAALSAGDLALARDLAESLVISASHLDARPIEAEALLERADHMDAVLRRLSL